MKFITKINLLKPKYSGKYCGLNEYDYRRQNFRYLFEKYAALSQPRLVGITDQTIIDWKFEVGRGFLIK